MKSQAVPLVVFAAAFLVAAVAAYAADAPNKARTPDPSRVVISTATFGLPNPDEDVPRYQRADRIALARKYLEVAGERGSDFALLPELFATKRATDQAQAEEVPGGPASSMMAEEARKWHMYVLGSLYENDGGKIYSIVPLFDREGRLAGKYRKVHLPDYEVLIAEAGDSFPVFQTDVGTVGALVCWDMQFPESMRCLALQGARVVFWPTMYAGDEPTQAIVEGAGDPQQGPRGHVELHRSHAGVHIGFGSVIDPEGRILVNGGNGSRRLHSDGRPDEDAARGRISRASGGPRRTERS